MTPAELLRESIASRILELCALWDEVSTSDLQGMADVMAGEIIQQVQDHKEGTTS